MDKKRMILFSIIAVIAFALCHGSFPANAKTMMDTGTPLYDQAGDTFEFGGVLYEITSIGSSGEYYGTTKAIGRAKENDTSQTVIGISNASLRVSEGEDGFKDFQCTEIAKNAFKDDKLIYVLIIDEKTGVQKIPQGAFSNCRKLTYVHIHGNKLQKIEKNAFSKSKKIRYLGITGSCIKSIDKNAFKKGTKTILNIRSTNDMKYGKKVKKLLNKAGIKVKKIYTY
ncbi:leucine-rich repeat protein [Butyrivibrio sp. WCD2001]|uniref:leucine-rich repeat protein n=1 Tax=Butyrivibrio sp. WCD2001 TaxID=1280681 RepID=UPI00042979EC|nr:leucine-rich repeat protein [Butyrivibrio sp. WCD2001]